MRLHKAVWKLEKKGQREGTRQMWLCQPQLAPPFSFDVAPHSVAPG